MKRTLLNIILCGMIATPAAIMPMFNDYGDGYGYQDHGQRCNINCLGEMKRPDELTRLGACWHRHCTECLRDVVEDGLGRRQLALLRCPTQYCNVQLNRQDIAQLIRDQALLGIYDELIEQQRMQADPNVRHCPTPDCNRVFIFNAAQGPQLIDCPDCHRNYCNDCLAQHPQGAQCNRRANGIDAVRGNPNFRACPQCQRPIERIMGCDYMRCRLDQGGCDHEFCWRCLVPDPGHRHMYCLPDDLARAQAIYGNEAGAPNNNQPGINVNQPFRRDGVWPNVPPRNRFPFFIIACAAVTGAAGFAVYKLYKYLSIPKELPIQDLEVSFGNLLKEATRCKRLSDNGLYVRDSFKNYFVNEEKNKAFASLDATELAALKKIVDNLDAAFAAGHCEREYLALVEAYRATKDAAASNKPDAAQAPEPQVKKVTVPATAKKVPQRTNRRVHQARKGK